MALDKKWVFGSTPGPPVGIDFISQGKFVVIAEAKLDVQVTETPQPLFGSRGPWMGTPIHSRRALYM